MSRMRFPVAALAVALGLLACGNAPSGPGRRADAAAEAGDGGELPEGAPFDTALETWEFALVDGAVCGNGSPLGVAVNRTDRSGDVVLFFAGGGACWDAASCFALGGAVHINENVGENVVLAEAQAGALRLFLDRDDPSNAFPDASYVYVPYCTGDVHAGTRVATYDVLGTPTEVHHLGAVNTDLILARMRATWPQAERVWPVGVSAGGYGATMNWWRVAEAFPGATVDALSDSGLPIAPLATRMGEMRTAWAPRFPPGCADCATSTGFGALLPHYAGTMPAGARYGLLAYLQDNVIGLYFNLDIPAVERALGDVRSAAAAGQHTFYVGDTVAHVLSGNPALTRDETSVADFVLGFATRDPGWADVGP